MKFVCDGSMAIHKPSLAIDWGYSSAPQQEPELIGDVAIIRVRGPLSHHTEWFFESYDALLMRAQAAFFAMPCTKVLIMGDTPGGAVSGCFATSRILRQMADESGKPFDWYVDGMTCSAGLSLAMACDHVYVPPEGRFGSIGVIAELVSHAKSARANGLEFELVTSGERKSDGHPLADIDKATIASVQASVDYEARLFFEWVAERTGVSAAVVESWGARVFYGQEAVDVGIADAVTNDMGALELVSGAEQQGDTNMPGALKNARASSAASSAKTSLEDLRKRAAELAGEDSAEGRRARKALDALDDDGAEEEPAEPKEPKHDEPDGDEGEDSDDDGDDASAAEDSDDASAAEDSDDASAAEDSDDASAAEDSDDARKAEAEEDGARKAEAAAKRSLAAADDFARKARQALRSGAKNAAADAREHLACEDRKRREAKAFATEAKQHRSAAGVYRSNAGVHARLNTLAKVATASGAKLRTRPTAAAAIAGARSSGTQGQAPKPAQGAAKRQIPRAMAMRAGLIHEAVVAVEDEDSDSEGLGLVSPDQARDYYAKLQAEVKSIGGRS